MYVSASRFLAIVEEWYIGTFCWTVSVSDMMMPQIDQRCAAEDDDYGRAVSGVGAVEIDHSRVSASGFICSGLRAPAALDDPKA